MDIRPIGGQKALKVDVQIVSATNRDLEAMVAQRLFRADLYYRLNAYMICLPPLATRSDFGSVVRHLMQAMAPGTPVTDAAIQALAGRKWPGNIRELKTVLQRALVRRQADYIDENCFDDIAPTRQFSLDCCDECRARPLSRAKCQEIRAVYRRTEENISHTARELGLSRTTVYKHIRSAFQKQRP
jgi:transcriptional regulator of acetoin/glycerol metabolism